MQKNFVWVKLVILHFSYFQLVDTVAHIYNKRSIKCPVKLKEKPLTVDYKRGTSNTLLKINFKILFFSNNLHISTLRFKWKKSEQ